MLVALSVCARSQGLSLKADENFWGEGYGGQQMLLVQRRGVRITTGSSWGWGILPCFCHLNGRTQLHAYSLWDALGLGFSTDDSSLESFLPANIHHRCYFIQPHAQTQNWMDFVCMEDYIATSNNTLRDTKWLRLHGAARLNIHMVDLMHRSDADRKWLS